MGAIFVSYRRDDTEGQAGRLFQDLRETFGAEMVFMDVATIAPGVDFRAAIERSTTSCGVLLALIGRNWLTVANANGGRRLDDADDFVRLETASALRRDIPVVPVLVQGARMPRADELPDDLKDLAYRNSVELTHARWDSDVRNLIDALRPFTDAGRTTDRADTSSHAPRRRGRIPVAIGAVIATLILLGLTWDLLGTRSSNQAGLRSAVASGVGPLNESTSRQPSPVATLRGDQTSGSDESTEHTASRTFSVAAAKGWQSTGVIVGNDEIVVIAYVEGTWRGNLTEPPYGPEGADSFGVAGSCFPSAQSPAGSLIGRIGTEPDVFFVGKGTRQSRIGRLFLRMNDCDAGLNDNDGSVAVRITVHRRGSTAS